MTDRLDRALTATLTAAALLLATTAAYQVFFRAAQPAAPANTASYEQDWRDAAAAGVWLGDSAAPIVLVVFSDLECPACSRFHATASRAVAKFHPKVALVFVHYPLTGHRFAIPAAQAAECAAAVGAFPDFVDAVYSKQDSLGLKSWGSFALDAGISDTVAIRDCSRRSTVAPRIEAGRELGLRWNVVATPTVLINRLRYSLPPTATEIDRAVAELLGSGQTK
jgi:protein-disulfide isomerase